MAEEVAEGGSKLPPVRQPDCWNRGGKWHVAVNFWKSASEVSSVPRNSKKILLQKNGPRRRRFPSSAVPRGTKWSVLRSLESSVQSAGIFF